MPIMLVVNRDYLSANNKNPGPLLKEPGLNIILFNNLQKC